MGQAVLEFLKGLLTEGVPDVGNIEVRVGLLSQEVCQRFYYVREVLDKLAVVSSQTKEGPKFGETRLYRPLFNGLYFPWVHLNSFG